MLPLDYIGGLIDADGSICISISKNRYTSKKSPGTESVQFGFVVNFRQVAEYRTVLDEIKETLGCGTIYKHANNNGREMLSWQTTNEADTLRICTILLPHLRIKHREALYMIEALTVWREGRLGAKGAGFYHTDEAKRRVLEISSQMNPSQQKETSRRNKNLRLDGYITPPTTTIMIHESPVSAFRKSV